jgi:hypothetical protein
VPSNAHRKKLMSPTSGLSARTVCTVPLVSVLGYTTGLMKKSIWVRKPSA